MSQLPLNDAVERFQQNEERIDKFVNSSSGYTSSSGTPVESLPAFLARQEQEIEQTTGTVAANLTASQGARSGAEAARDAAQAARDAAVINSTMYPTEAAGRAAVADGAYFKVIGTGDVACFEYRRTNSSTSVLVATYPSKSFVEAELDQLSAFVVVPKKVLTNVRALKSNSSSTAAIDAQYTRTDAGVSVVMGYDVTLNNVSGYVYSYAQFFSNYATEAASKNFRFFVKSNNKTTTVALRLTNGSAWGSPDGSLGQITAERSVVLNADNNYQATIDIDYSAADIAAFYAQTVRAKAGYFILAYDGTTTSEAIKLSTYCSEVIGVSAPAADMTYGYVASDLGAQIDYLQTKLDATTAEIATPKAPLTNINAIKLNSSSTATIETVYTRKVGVKTINTGYDVTLNNVSGYAYSYAKLFDTYATQASTKKYRVFVKSNNKDATIQVRFTNAAAWGSSDGSVGQVTNETVLQLNAANKYQATVDIDYSAADIAAFYAQTVRLKAGYVILALTDIVSSQSVVFSTYCYEITPTSSSAADMTRGYVSQIIGMAELEQRVDQLSSKLVPSYITCWGDSLTAGGGWTTTLATLSGLPVYNGGTGGENSQTIMARQGGDVMVVNNITIPATTTPVLIASRSTDGGIKTALGATVTPLLQGGAHVNPCYIGDVLGTLSWTGSSYADMNGTWTFTRSAAGSEVQIKRPTAIRTDFDINRNGSIQIIFIGQNGGYTSNDDLIRQHRLMIEHSTAKHTIILGLSSGSAASRTDYEAAMKLAFGRYFISLREYLAAPIYTNGVITSCYGLDDAGITPTSADLTAIASGTVPPSLLADAVHYNTACKTVIGNMLYKKMKDLNVF